jgi:pSer/pThr/pTyr-binding forkhead associated (FHA) protein
MPSRLKALTAGSDILISRSLVLVGRHPLCDVQIDSFQVSRRHCCLSEAPGGVEVRDLNSTNGVRINGQRVASGRLRPGDELWIAHAQYRVEGGPADDAGPPTMDHRPAASRPEDGAPT